MKQYIAEALRRCFGRRPLARLKDFRLPECLQDPKFHEWVDSLDAAAKRMLLDEIVEREMDRLGVSAEAREIVRARSIEVDREVVEKLGVPAAR